MYMALLVTFVSYISLETREALVSTQLYNKTQHLYGYITLPKKTTSTSVMQSIGQVNL